MTLKNWKKQKVDKRELMHPEDITSVFAYNKKENAGYLPYDIIIYKNKNKKYIVEIDDENKIKSFDTKSEAMIYANKYMRKH